MFWKIFSYDLSFKEALIYISNHIYELKIESLAKTLNHQLAIIS